MSEKISRKEALKRIAMIGGAVAGAAVISSCIPTVSYAKYCNIGCHNYSMDRVSSYCDYSNWSVYCDYGYNYTACYYSC